MRFSQPSRATQLKIQASSACPETWLWLKTMAGGIDARGDEGGRDLAGVLGKLFGVLEHGDGVEIDHAIEVAMLGLKRHEFGDGAEIVAEMEIAGRLHAGETRVLVLYLCMSCPCRRPARPASRRNRRVSRSPP